MSVPLTAAMYGRRKLEVSPFKVAVEEDRKTDRVKENETPRVNFY